VSPATIRRRAQARERRSLTERSILDATESLLADRSFHDLTVEDVMTATGLSRTAFYRYFPDLQAVLLRRMTEIAEELQAACALWLGPGADARTGLLDGARGLADVYRRHGRLLLAYNDAASSAPEVAAAWRTTVEGFIQPVIARIEGLGAIGNPLEHPDQVARALVWMIERYLLDTYGRGPEVPMEVAADTLALIWRRTLLAAES
jgi:AcrR family transcriptional regulator